MQLPESSFVGSNLKLDMGPAYAFNSIQDHLRENLILDEDEEWTTGSFEFYPADSSERCEIFEESNSNDESFICEDVEGDPLRENGFENVGTHMTYLNQYVMPHVQNKIIYNATATTVDYRQNYVRVCTTGDTSYRAKNVIVALPLPLLKDKDIKFKPDLPSYLRDEIESIGLVDGLRFWIEFDEKFYPDSLELVREGSFAIYCIDAFLGQPSERHVLTNVGIGATGLTELSDQEVIERVLDDLDAAYDGKARASLVDHYVQNWSKKPLTRYIFSDDVTPRDFNIFDAPVDDRVYITGEFAVEGRNFYLNSRRAVEKVVLKEGEFNYQFEAEEEILEDLYFDFDEPNEEWPEDESYEDEEEEDESLHSEEYKQDESPDESFDLDEDEEQEEESFDQDEEEEQEEESSDSEEQEEEWPDDFEEANVKLFRLTTGSETNAKHSGCACIARLPTSWKLISFALLFGFP